MVLIIFRLILRIMLKCCLLECTDCEACFRTWRMLHCSDCKPQCKKFSDSTAVRSHCSRPHNKYSLQYLYWNRPSSIKLFFLKIEKIGYSNSNLNTPITTVECCNEITITIAITDKNYNYSNNYEILIYYIVGVRANPRMWQNFQKSLFCINR